MTPASLRRAAIVLAATATPWACSPIDREPPADAARSPGCGSGAHPAGIATATVQVGDTERTTRTWVPQDYFSEYPFRLVLMFHGAGGSGRDFELFTFMQDGADSTALLTYPDALPDAEDVARWSSDDLEFVDAMIDQLGSEYCIDENRVFAVGFSNGGSFANSLACNRSDSTRAIVSVSGAGPFEPCPVAIPAMVVHGTNDPVVEFAQGQATREHWVGKNGCDDQTRPSAAACEDHTGCRAPVRFCEHDQPVTSAHTWPDFAPAAIWDFLGQT